MIPWKLLDEASVPGGADTLRFYQRGDEFSIRVGAHELMNSRRHGSEDELGLRACKALADRAAPRALIGGLGMGCTLRAANEGLPDDAVIEVSEITPIVARWSAGPLAVVNHRALDDPRVRLTIEDVTQTIAARADDRARPRLDAILLDLYEGLHAGTNANWDPFYGRSALDASRRALAIGGVFAIWSEAPDTAFEKRVTSIGFELERFRPGKGGRRHVVYLATRRR